VARLGAGDLTQVWIDLRSVLSLIDKPSISNFSIVIPGSAEPVPVRYYQAKELRRLRQITEEAKT
jgi:hypothetical protein